MRSRDACSSRLRSASSLERRLQRGVEPDVVQRQPQLAGQLDQRALVVGRERRRVGRDGARRSGRAVRPGARSGRRAGPPRGRRTSATTPRPTPDRRCGPGRRPRVRARASANRSDGQRRHAHGAAQHVRRCRSRSRRRRSGSRRGNDSTSCSSTSSIGTERVMRAPKVATRSSTEPRAAADETAPEFGQAVARRNGQHHRPPPPRPGWRSARRGPCRAADRRCRRRRRGRRPR